MSFLKKFGWNMVYGGWVALVFLLGCALAIGLILVFGVCLSAGVGLSYHLIEHHNFPDWVIAPLGIGGVIVGGGFFYAVIAKMILEPLMKNLNWERIIFWPHFHNP